MSDLKLRNCSEKHTGMFRWVENKKVNTLAEAVKSVIKN